MSHSLYIYCLYEMYYQAVNNYALRHHSISAETEVSPDGTVAVISSRVLRNTSRKRRVTPRVAGPISQEAIFENSKLLLEQFFFVRQAHRSPKSYLRVLSHVYMTVELIALMTPMIAMGIQWLTALCPGPPLPSLITVFSTIGTCLIYGDFGCKDLQSSCIVVANY